MLLKVQAFAAYLRIYTSNYVYDREVFVKGFNSDGEPDILRAQVNQFGNFGRVREVSQETKDRLRANHPDGFQRTRLKPTSWRVP